MALERSQTPFQTVASARTEDRGHVPDVRDAASLVQAYQRIGTKGVGDGYYETEAALEAGRSVAKELSAHRGMKAAPTPAAAR